MIVENVVIDSKKVLVNFMQDMHQWETTYYPLITIKSEKMDHENKPIDFDDPYWNEIKENEKKAREELSTIYSKYLVPKERKYGRESALTMGEPPEYDLAAELFEEWEIVNNKKVIFYTQQTIGFELKNRYSLIYKNKEWRIAKKEYLGFPEKWKNLVF